MKKKILTFILALCLIIPATFMFTACSTTKDDNVQIRVQDGYVQWSSDDSDWKNVITIDEILDAIGDDITGPQGEQGVAGKQVEFNVSSTHIQWRYVGDSAWNNLVKLEDLEEILKSGKIVNGFEVNKIHNFIEARRRETEKDLFGIPEDAKPSVRPIYGYLSNKELENGMTGVKVAMYGDIKIVLDNKVKKNSTITIGDSLDRSSVLYPSKLTDIKLYSGYIRDYLDIKEGGLRGLYAYPEVQIFGGIKLEDIYQIEIPKEYKTAELSKLLSSKGIKVKWK